MDTIYIRIPIHIFSQKYAKFLLVVLDLND